jgi:hypothetical protein
MTDHGVTTAPRQLGGWLVADPRAVTVGHIVRYDEARAGTRLRSAAALAVALWVVLIAAQWELPLSDASAAHPHAAGAQSAHSVEWAVITDHAHVQDGSTPAVPQTIAAAVLPRASIGLIALGLIAAVIVLAGSCARGVLATVRGPPRALVTVLSGQQVLTRFCIARR